MVLDTLVHETHIIGDEGHGEERAAVRSRSPREIPFCQLDQGACPRHPANNNGLFYRNSRIGQNDIRDELSQTLMIGERSRNVADATWVGAIPGVSSDQF